MDLDNRIIKKIRWLVLYTVILLVAAWNYKVVFHYIGMAGNVILPFLIGGAVAFILNVPMSFLEKCIFYNKYTEKNKMAKKLARPFSLLLTLALFVGLLVLVMFVVLPELGKTFLNLGGNIQDFLSDMQTKAMDMFQNNPSVVEWISQIQINWESLFQNAVDFLKTGAGNVIGSTYTAARSIISGIMTFFIAFVFACYILLQKEKLRVQVTKIMYAFMKKKHVEKVMEICSLTYRTFSNFLTGQCLEACILGMMFIITMNIFRFPYAMLVGILIAFTALIPIFGAFIGCVIGTFLILVINPMQAVMFVILFLVLQQVEGNLIYPHVVGSSVGLPSIWVLAAVSIGGSLMGIVGMLIFIPLVSVLYSLFKKYVYGRLREKEIKIDEKGYAKS